jgi:hypothetical protein
MAIIFDEDQQKMYETLDEYEQGQVDNAPDASKIQVLTALFNAKAAKLSGQSQQPNDLIFKGGGTIPTEDLTNTYLQQALGVSGGRRVSVTGQIIPGTYTGFQAPPRQATPMEELRGRGGAARQPIYFAGDEDKIALFTKEEIASVQAQMKKAGILGSNYRIGKADEATVAAFQKVLEQANRDLTEWRYALNNLEASTPPSKGLQYRVSNPDDIGDIIEQTSRKVLGRTVDDATRQRLIKAYQQLQIEEQRAAAVGTPMVVQTPDVTTFAQKKLEKMAGPEADAYKFAEFASSLLGR